MSEELKVSLSVNGKKVPTDDLVEFIRWNHALLCSFRDDGREPSQELLDDIRAYDCILGLPTDAERQARARVYAEARLQSRALSAEKPRPRMVARLLGWMP